MQVLNEGFEQKKSGLDEDLDEGLLLLLLLLRNYGKIIFFNLKNEVAFVLNELGRKKILKKNNIQLSIDAGNSQFGWSRAQHMIKYDVVF